MKSFKKLREIKDLMDTAPAKQRISKRIQQLIESGAEMQWYSGTVRIKI